MNFSTNQTFINVKDYSVSQETFSLLYNQEYDILKTFPEPSADNLGKYYESDDYISHTDGKRNLFERLYHLVKNRALKNKVSLINKFHAKGQLLDIGCGTGDFLIQAKNDGWNVLGYEPSNKARQISMNKGVSLIENLSSIPENSFDVITMWHVLEHVPNIEEHIALLKNIIKPNGIIIIAVPNYKSFDANYYKNFWAAYDVPRHLWHFSKKSIKKLFFNQKMKLLHVKPMWFDSFYVALLSEKYKTGKMNFIKGFLVGFYSNFKGLFTKEISSHIYIIKNNINS